MIRIYLFREIAGPEAGAPAAPALDSELDQAFRPVQFFLELVFRKVRRQAAAAHRDALQIDIGLARIEGHASVAGRRKDASPIRVRARDGRLDQRRISDRPRDLLRARIARRAATSMVTSLRAPSPSLTICLASDSSTSVSASSNAFAAGRTFDAPLASTATVSLVEVSPSTEMRL